MRILRPAPICAFLFSIATGVVALLASRTDDWDRPAMLALLVLFALVADRFEIRTRSGIYVAGSMPVFVLVAVLWGPAPAAALGATVALVQLGKAWDVRIGDVATLAGFALVTGLAARLGHVQDPVHDWLAFMALVSGVYMLAAVVNFSLVAVYMRMLRGRSFSMNIASTWRPLVNTQLVHALGTAGLAYGYVRIGSAVIVFAGVLAVTFSRLQRDLMEAERLRDEATERNEELAAANERLRRAHFGAMRSLVRSIHLHDQMTARHSAAVARYARRIAEAAGCPEAEQRLVHTAALYHDVGKVMFADRMFKAGKLTDEEWESV